MTRASRAALIALALMAAGTAQAAERSDPIPRFASLRSGLVNLRSGPGDRYPVEWVYRRKGLPIEIIAQYDEWWQVRDSQGTTGWMSESLVTANRTVLVSGAQRTLRLEPDDSSPAVAKLDPGVIAQLIECRGGWCRIEAQSIKGWLARGEIWGVYPDEVVR